MYVTNVHPFPKKYIMGEESFSVTFFFPIVKSLSPPPTLLQTEKRRNKTQNETLLPLKHSDPCHHRRPWQPPPLTPQDQSTTVFLSNPSSLICSLIPLLLFSCQLSNSAAPWTAARWAFLSSPSPGACSNSCPLCQWCHPTISSSVIPFSSCFQSLPASGSSPISWLLASADQSIGASASTSVLSMNIQTDFL